MLLIGGALGGEGEGGVFCKACRERAERFVWGAGDRGPGHPQERALGRRGAWRRVGGDQLESIPSTRNQ